VYMAVRWPPRDVVRLLSLVAVLVLGGSFVVAIFMPTAGLDAEHRLRGLFAHKNSLAAFAALALICAADGVTGRDRPPGRLPWITALFGLTALALTASASPVPGMIVAVVLIRRIKRLPLGKPHVLTARLCTGVFIGIVLLPWLAPYIGQIALLFGRSTDFSGRTLVWRFAIEFFQRNPLLGYGYASFWNGPAGLLFVNYAHFPVPHAHNGALQLLLDAGIIGLALFGAVLASALRGLERILNVAQRGANAWLAGFLVLYLFASLAETHMLEPNDLYTVLFAYAVVRINLTRSQSEDKSLSPSVSHL
jgi:exopolysaccharide production protein ExoQ